MSSLETFFELVYMVRGSSWFMLLDTAYGEIAAVIGAFLSENNRNSIVRAALGFWKAFSLSFKLVPVTCLTKHVPIDEL